MVKENDNRHSRNSTISKETKDTNSDEHSQSNKVFFILPEWNSPIFIKMEKLKRKKDLIAIHTELQFHECSSTILKKGQSSMNLINAVSVERLSTISILQYRNSSPSPSFMTQNLTDKLEEFLVENKIDTWQLLPSYIMKVIFENEQSKISYLPIQWFDEDEFTYINFDVYKLNVINDYDDEIMAIGFLPKEFLLKNHDTDFKQLYNEEKDKYKGQDIKNFYKTFYGWKKVKVIEYNNENHMWIVQDLITNHLFKIPKVILMFYTENLIKFVEKLKYVLDTRQKIEELIKFNFIIDCAPIIGIPQLPNKICENIQKEIKKTHPNIDEYLLHEFENEITILYNKRQIEAQVRYVNQKDPKMIPIDTIPEQFSKDIKPMVIMKIGKFDKLFKNIKRIILYYAPEVYLAMNKVVMKCENMQNTRIFTTNIAKSPLSEFCLSQEYTRNIAIENLKRTSIEALSEQIRLNFHGLGGWIDINLYDWEIYKLSKISKFLALVRYHVLNSFEICLKQSIRVYKDWLCEPCEPMLNVENSYVWNGPLSECPFGQSENVLFVLSLKFTEKSSLYTVNLEDFPKFLVKIIDGAMAQIAEIPEFDALVMQNLNFSKNRYLPIVQIIQEYVQYEINQIILSYEKVSIVLRAYSRRYDDFVELYFLNVNEWIKEFTSNKNPPTPIKIKEQILLQIKLEKYLTENLPEKIVIGPFLISIGPVRQHLISKRKEIIKKLFEYFETDLRNRTLKMNQEFYDIMKKISDKSTSIEHLLDVQEFIETIPDVLDKLDDLVRKILLEYDVLESLNYNISDKDFLSKFQMMYWKYKIYHQLPNTHERHEKQIEEFKKLQNNEIFAFEHDIEELSIDVGKLALEYDVNKVMEIAVNVKKLWKRIQELKYQGEILSRRQLIFDNQELSLSLLDEIKKNFQPYRELWLTGAELRDTDELILGNPIVNVDIDEIEVNVKNLEKKLQISLDLFKEKPEISDVIETFLQYVDQLKPKIEILKRVKSSNWTILQWQEFYMITKLNIKYSASMNLQYCVKKGILSQIDVLREISDRAENDANKQKNMKEEEDKIKKENELKLAEKRKMRRGRTDI